MIHSREVEGELEKLRSEGNWVEFGLAEMVPFGSSGKLGLCSLGAHTETSLARQWRATRSCCLRGSGNGNGTRSGTAA